MEIDLTSKIVAANENKTLNKPFRTPKGPKKFLKVVVKHLEILISLGQP